MSGEFFERLRQRAVEIHVEDHLRARLERGDQLRVKLGLDPTAPDLHVGHLVVLDVLRAFQDDGHTVVLIVGDFTAMIGDPSGRSETRPILSREQVDAAARTYLDQIYLVLNRERLEVRRNSEWLGEMKGADVLRLLGKATLQQVLQREDFAERLKAGTPIGAHEILYPFNQAYDSVAIEADVEIGGTDQLFNLLFGREIQKAYGQEPQDIAVFPLVEGMDGDIDAMSLWAGQSVALVHKRQPAAEIVREIDSEAQAILLRLARRPRFLFAESVVGGHNETSAQFHIRQQCKRSFPSRPLLPNPRRPNNLFAEIPTDSGAQPMQVNLITLDPGHFHAALVQKEMYANVAGRVHVYAPLGPDLLAHLGCIAGFNARPHHPTRWELEIHAGPDYLERFAREKPGNVVVLSGRNRVKVDYLEAAIKAGMHVLADKPWVIRVEDLPRLEAVLDTAEQQGLVAYEEALRWASNVDEFKLKVQGIATTSETAREEMAKSITGGADAIPGLTRFGS